MELPTRRLFVFLAMSVFLSACASRRVQEQVDVSFPPVGALTTKGVGEPLLRQEHGVVVPLLVVPEDQSIGGLRIRKGNYKAQTQNSEGIWILGLATGSPERSENVLLLPDGKTLCAWPRSGKVCAELQFSLEKGVADQSPDFFQQTLLYNGRIGNRVTLGYREFSHQIARPAFSNDVAYDLSESSTLGYKGARIEVIRATNTDITYRVLSGFQ